MNALAVAREIAAPPPAYSRHFEAPRWWPEWIAQVLASAAPAVEDRAPSVADHARADATTRPATPAADLPGNRELREALAAVAAAEADVDLDPLAAAAVRHQLFLARRAWRAGVEQAAGPSAQGCSCAAEGHAAP